MRDGTDRGSIQQVLTVDPVIAGYFMIQPLQMSRNGGTHVTAVSRDQKAHDPMIGRSLAGVPVDYGHEKGLAGGGFTSPARSASPTAQADGEVASQGRSLGYETYDARLG